MKEENPAGWCALYLSIMQNISPPKALAVMEGRAKGWRRLTWRQFLAAYRAGEDRIREERRRRNGSEKMREYQKEYRRTHPLTQAQRAKRREYLKRYRDARKPGKQGAGSQSKRAEAIADSSASVSPEEPDTSRKTQASPPRIVQ